MSVSGTNSETQIYLTLLDAGLNKAAACGILANIEAESSFNPKNLQNTYESRLGYNDDSYTSAVDKGTYSREKFIQDSAGYGLVQWTYYSRKADLYHYVRTVKRTSIGDLDAQVHFMIKEMQSTKIQSDDTHKGMTVWDYMSSTIQDTNVGAYEAAYYFCLDYEAPSNKETKAKERGVKARDLYWSYYANTTIEDTIVPNIGQRIVQYAMNQVGKPYEAGASGPESFDDIGLVVASYSAGGHAIPAYVDARDSYLNILKYNTTRIITDRTQICAGDLLYYQTEYADLSKSLTVGIATGDGGVIITGADQVLQLSSIAYPTIILRALSDAETSQGEIPAGVGGGFVGTTAIDYIHLTIDDPYSEQVSSNLQRVQVNNYQDYRKTGYLIDMTNGGEFKFIIPEFTETAGVEWAGVELRGRSVSVKAYDHTRSRTIPLSLDLYAGAGLYESSSLKDAVDRLHKDTDFVKSLEYPDYSNAIVRPPSVVHLILGPSLSMLGVVSDVSVEHLKPLDDRGKSMYIKLSFTVTQIAKNPPDYSDIRAGRYTSEDYSISSSYIGGNNQ